jgi:hypothetical protein
MTIVNDTSPQILFRTSTKNNANMMDKANEIKQMVENPAAGTNI